MPSRCDPVPAVGQPQRRRRIAAVGDELAPFAVGHAAGWRSRADARKTRWRGRSLSKAKPSPARRSRRCPRGPRCKRQRLGAQQQAGPRAQLAIGRLERVLGEGREDVGQHQFLVLLLVIDAELDQLERRRRKLGQSARSSASSTCAAIAAHLVQRRAAEHAPLGPRMPLALALVIAVEQIGEALVERPVAGHMVAQHEGLEEPGRVGEVPFGRRGVGERLDRRVGVADSGAARSSVSARVANSRAARRLAGVRPSHAVAMKCRVEAEVR